MSRRNNHRSLIVLSVLVVGAAGLAVWSNRQVPDTVRLERQGKLLPALRRDRINRMEVTGASGRFEAVKEAGRWFLIADGRRFHADDNEVERLLTEAEFVSPSRRLGTLGGDERTRFGLASPRARVTLREGPSVAISFAVGGPLDEEPGAYVEVEGTGFVVGRTFADAFVQPAQALRERTLSDLEPSRLARLEIEADGSRHVLERRDSIWQLTTPAEGRVARTQLESMLNDLRDMRATRFVTDDADAESLSRWGLSPARLTVRATRDPSGAVHTWRFGGPCEGHDDEVMVMRGEERTVACVGRTIADNLARPASELRDERVLWSHPDEIEQVRVHAPSGEFTLRREGDGWRLEGGTGTADGDAVDAWLSALGSLSAEVRLEADTAAAHALAPAEYWLEITRTAIEGSERIEIGRPDADRMYVRRAGETTVLGLEPGSAETLRIDGARFRSRQLVRDVPDELATLITETPEFRDEAQHRDGTWQLLAPFARPADPAVMRLAAQRLASLDAVRWVSLSPRPEHGLSQPRLRLTARFEGNGVQQGDRDAGTARVREYVLSVGAMAPGGGAYASLGGSDGVFVLSRDVLEELSQPRVDRTLLEAERTAVQRIEITRPRAGGGLERVAIRRDGEVWRTDAGAPVDRARVTALLEQLTLVRAPRAFGYGPAPTQARLGMLTLALTLSDATAAPRQVRLTLGAPFGTRDDGGVYARLSDLDATLAVPHELADALREFTP